MRTPDQVMGDKAIGLLRRVHESGQLRDTLIGREVADLLGVPGDPEVARIEKATQKWNEQAEGRGFHVMKIAVRTEANRLREIANAIGAGSAAGKALADLKALADVVESL